MKEWRSVTKELPPYWLLVLCWDSTTRAVYIGHRECTDVWGDVWRSNPLPDGVIRNFRTVSITHWMHLPEAPK